MDSGIGEFPSILCYYRRFARVVLRSALDLHSVQNAVIPAQAGIQTEDMNTVSLDPRLRGGDEEIDFADHVESQRPVCPAGTKVIVCYNKTDLTGTPVMSPEYLPNAVSVSALTGEGIEALLNAVIRCLVPYPPKPGEAVQLYSRCTE